jgi:oxalate decarboxylase/phosphoglucose isomerase-like protein (cupin superfamily)
MDIQYTRGDCEMLDTDVILKRFDDPDELRTFDKGTFELLEIGGMTIGRATYQPGWRWSKDVGAALGELHCHVEHVGMVISGCVTAAVANSEIVEMRPGDVFYVPASPHDSWVVGDEPYVSLHFLGAASYARK